MSLFRYTRADAGRATQAFPLLWIALIALILGAVALAFAWLAGWIGDRLTAQRFTDTIEATGPAIPGSAVRTARASA
jgi:catalase